MPRKDSSRIWTVIGFLWLGATVQLSAQQYYGSLTGTVMDPSGAALPEGEGSFTAAAVGITAAACMPKPNETKKELYRLTVR